MPEPFKYFVILAEMRTGSNFLETNLNALPGLACHGEAFNPHFIGYPDAPEVLGMTQAMRDADPHALIARIRTEPGGLCGFRYFHDHDPRVLETVLDDPRCAKVILTRNPLDSYVSWKIAQATGQWKLTDVKRRKEAKADFDADEFEALVDVQQAFQMRILNRLQCSGQTAFYIGYEDLQSVEVINGLARWLGIDGALESLDKSLKPQNPGPIAEKVSNPDGVSAALTRMDRFNLSRTPNFEPRRGPSVPGYVAAARSPLLYLPVRCGPEQQVADWLAELDGVSPDDLLRKMTQKRLRNWKRAHPGHRSFTVLRHPVERAHAAFFEKILSVEPGGYLKIRQTLRRQFKLPIPDSPTDTSYDVDAHRTAFIAFLEFLRSNLAGQTGIRVDPAWCTQAQALSGFSEFVPPDHIFRETELPRMLPLLAEAVGKASPQVPSQAPYLHPLSSIYDDELENLVAEVYQRDYVMFGFGAWSDK